MLQFIIMRKIKNRRGGFSLAEMVVVIAIMGILTGILLVYNRSTEKYMMLYTERSKVIGVLNRAKTLALQKYKEEGIGGPRDYTEEEICAYGVRFISDSEYELFYVKKKIEDVDCNIASSQSVKESIKLDSRIKFNTGTTMKYVAFEAPYLNVTTDGGQDIELQVPGSIPLMKAIINISGGSITAM